MISRETKAFDIWVFYSALLIKAQVAITKTMKNDITRISSVPRHLIHPALWLQGGKTTWETKVRTKDVDETTTRRTCRCYQNKISRSSHDVWKTTSNKWLKWVGFSSAGCKNSEVFCCTSLQTSVNSKTRLLVPGFDKMHPRPLFMRHDDFFKSELSIRSQREKN